MARETCPTHQIALTPEGCLLCNRSQAAEPPARGWRLALSLAGLAMGLGALVFGDARGVEPLRRMALRLPSVAAMEAELAELEAEDIGGTFNVIPAARYDDLDGDAGEGEVIVHPEAETTNETEVVVGGRVVSDETPKPAIKVVHVRPGPITVSQRTRPVFYGGGSDVPRTPGFRPRYRRGTDGKFRPRGGKPAGEPAGRGTTRGSGATPRRTLPAPKIGAPR